ncbi:unnamed protein product [Bemisia tabaci]|uniref:Uncharacterized protein n=1 Tax=Bemisia tabaci TaxID=7038 RepID=A0A9P0F3R9_BEMTA|nr:unnamed protein product [Bemisia tabaci]
MFPYLKKKKKKKKSRSGRRPRRPHSCRPSHLPRQPSKPASRPASPALSRHSVYERKPKGDPTKRISSKSKVTVPKRRAPMASASPKKPNKQFRAVDPREVAVDPRTVVRAHPSIEVTTSASLLKQPKRVSRIPVKCVNPRPRPAASAAAPGQSAVDGPGPAVHQPPPVTLDIEDILLQTPEPIRTPPSSSPFLPSLSPTPPAPRQQATPRPAVTPPAFGSPINLVSPSVVILSPIASPSSTLRPQSLRGSPRRPMIIKVADAKLQTPAWMVESLIEEYLGRAPSKALPPWMVWKMELAACRSRARARHRRCQAADSSLDGGESHRRVSGKGAIQSAAALDGAEDGVNAACRSRASARQHQEDQQEEGRRRGSQHGGRRPEPRQRSHRSDQPRSGSRHSRKDQRR